MRAILTRERNGKFPDVGMSDRFVTGRYKRRSTLIRYAVAPYARATGPGTKIRVEIFPDAPEAFYRDPVETFVYQGGK